jgi:hypothetical protein
MPVTIGTNLNKILKIMAMKFKLIESPMDGDYAIFEIKDSGTLTFRVVWYDAGGSEGYFEEFKTLTQARNSVQKSFDLEWSM